MLAINTDQQRGMSNPGNLAASWAVWLGGRV